MKKNVSIIIVAVTSIVLLSSCVGLFCEEGDGAIIKQNREVAGFENIKLLGVGDVLIERGEAFSCIVEADKNILPMVKTKIVDKTLIIDKEKNICPTKLVIHITMPEIKSVVVAGSGDIKGTGLFPTDTFFVDIAGSGDVIFPDIDARTVKARISGSGDIKIGGRATSVYLKIGGAGDINLDKLICDKAKITIQGSGDCRVNARNELKAIINGSGTIFYFGDPIIQEKISGSGNLKKIKE